MPARHEISDADWDRIQDVLPGLPGQHGGVARDNRRFVNAVLWIAKTGAPWRDLPTRLGNWNSQWRRFDRWASKGRMGVIADQLRDPDVDVLILDPTVIRAHPCAAGAKKKRTGPGVTRARNSGGAGAGLAPRVMGVSTASANPSRCG